MLHCNIDSNKLKLHWKSKCQFYINKFSVWYNPKCVWMGSFCCSHKARLPFVSAGMYCKLRSAKMRKLVSLWYIYTGTSQCFTYMQWYNLKCLQWQYDDFWTMFLYTNIPSVSISATMRELGIRATTSQPMNHAIVQENPSWNFDPFLLEAH